MPHFEAFNFYSFPLMLRLGGREDRRGKLLCSNYCDNHREKYSILEEVFKRIVNVRITKARVIFYL